MAVDSDELASLGLALQYDYKGFFTNITAVDLAAILRNAIWNNVLYLGLNVTDRVSYHLSRNLTDTEAIEVLEGFDELDNDRWPWLAVPWITLTIVGGLFVIMRLFTRIRYCGGLRRDDWFLIIAYVRSEINEYATYIWSAQISNCHLSIDLLPGKQHSRYLAGSRSQLASTHLGQDVQRCSAP